MCLQTSTDSVLVSEEGKCRLEETDGDGSKRNTVIKNVHFTLPEVGNSVKYQKSLTFNSVASGLNDTHLLLIHYRDFNTYTLQYFPSLVSG